MKFAWHAAAASLLVVMCGPLGAATPSALAIGEAIYRDGVLPDGKPLAGVRDRLPSLDGAAAACVRCHRRSGLGSSEGGLSIPPITQRYLAQAREESRLSTDSKIAPGYHVGRPAFTDATLARAIREGIVPGALSLNELMPHYPLDDRAMASLIAYLQSLSRDAAPGVTAETLHFATIVTADADPLASQAMLDVLTRFFEAPNPAFGAPRKMLHPNRMVGYRSGARKWALHVWQLHGEPDTWEHQLRERLLAQPVLAVLSGMGGRDWTPVHRFCEREAIPCVLPNVDLPVVVEGDFYSVYFSAGVLLEAQLGAHWLTSLRADQHLSRVVQVYRAADIGVPAAESMHARLSAAGFDVVDRVVAAHADRAQWLSAVGEAGSRDALVLWARGDDLASLGDASPAPGTVLVSGLMGGLSAATLSPAWRARVRMTYPLDLPEHSAVRTGLPRAWLVDHHLPIVDERVQIDTYVACAAMSEVVGNLFDDVSRDLLIERFEDMLGSAVNPALYPRLGLAQGQRLASKGGYIVRFARPQGPELVAEGDWTVP